MDDALPVRGFREVMVALGGEPLLKQQGPSAKDLQTHS